MTTIFISAVLIFISGFFAGAATVIVISKEK